MMRDRTPTARGDSPPPTVPEPWQLGLPPDTPPREALLYARYVRALALLCECAPYVDEPDYADLIDTLLADACASYPLEWRRSAGRHEIAPRIDRAEGGSG
ncbi:MAG TPA: hypothetical protein VGP22_12675 [Albitalea sp.]|jgi:hypothetical protein|nr:hypothetical protein [Albitalea sp.]